MGGDLIMERILLEGLALALGLSALYMIASNMAHKNDHVIKYFNLNGHLGIEEIE